MGKLTRRLFGGSGRAPQVRLQGTNVDLDGFERIRMFKGNCAVFTHRPDPCEIGVFRAKCLRLPPPNNFAHWVVVAHPDFDDAEYWHGIMLPSGKWGRNLVAWNSEDAAVEFAIDLADTGLAPMRYTQVLLTDPRIVPARDGKKPFGELLVMFPPKPKNPSKKKGEEK